MTMDAFDPDWFGETVTFHPPGEAVELRGDVDPTFAGAGVTVPAYVESAPDWADRGEAHGAPESAKKVNVFTATDPGVGTDYGAAWRGKVLSVNGSAKDQSGRGVLWRTECSLVD